MLWWSLEYAVYDYVKHMVRAKVAQPKRNYQKLEMGAGGG